MLSACGFFGLQRVVARKKYRCNLLGNDLLIPHYTILSTVCLDTSGK